MIRPPIPSDHTKLGITGLLEITAPGTALDTVYGKYVLTHLYSLSEKELCTDTLNADFAYSACVLSSQDKSEKSKFNILQFAHQLALFTNSGSQCSRLEEFAA